MASDVAHRSIMNILTDPSVYDSSIRPYLDVPNAPVTVEIDVAMTSVGPVNEIDMTWGSTFFLRQEWTDPRLALRDYNGTVSLSSYQVTSLWLPDIYFSDGKEEREHVVTVPNKFLRISAQTGRILYSQRITAITNCVMDLQNYPFDRQKCNLTMESYAYTTSDLVLRWSLSRVATRLLPTAYIPDFTLEKVTIGDCSATYATGTYPCLRATVYFKREIYYYLTDTYVPSLLIVILSWASFWIDHEAVPARISVGLLTVLTITTQLTGSRSNLPRVPYIKAIDVWMTVNLVFVFVAYMEYAVVTVLSRRFKRRVKKASTLSNSASTFSVLSLSEGTVQESALTTESTASLASSKQQQGKFRLCDSTGNSKDTGRRVDQNARFLFPGLYVIFNIVYWVFYMSSRME